MGACNGVPAGDPDFVLVRLIIGTAPRERWVVLLVTPSTVLRWHRELIARRWTYPPNGRDRRGLDEEIVALVVRLARENPRWGYVRIVGECRSLGCGLRRLRYGGSCTGMVLGRHRAAAGRPGVSSCAPRLVGCWRRISSRWRQWA